jgi:hypothetical protein
VASHDTVEALADAHDVVELLHMQQLVQRILRPDDGAVLDDDSKLTFLMLARLLAPFIAQSDSAGTIAADLSALIYFFRAIPSTLHIYVRDFGEADPNFGEIHPIAIRAELALQLAAIPVSLVRVHYLDPVMEQSCRPQLLF